MNKESKYIVISIIISKFHFFQVEREVFFRYPMKLNQSFFRITPEVFQTVNAHLTGCKHFAMVYPQMSLTTKHQRIIAFTGVRVNKRAASYRFNSQIKERHKSFRSLTKRSVLQYGEVLISLITCPSTSNTISLVFRMLIK